MNMQTANKQATYAVRTVDGHAWDVFVYVIPAYTAAMRTTTDEGKQRTQSRVPR